MPRAAQGPGPPSAKGQGRRGAEADPDREARPARGPETHAGITAFTSATLQPPAALRYAARVELFVGFQVVQHFAALERGLARRGG